MRKKINVVENWSGLKLSALNGNSVREKFIALYMFVLLKKALEFLLLMFLHFKSKLLDEQWKIFQFSLC